MPREFHYKLCGALRNELKRPLGELIKGEAPLPYLRILEKVRKANYIITVGDIVTENILGVGVFPDIAIYDHKTKRKEYNPKIELDAVIITVNNPAGTITKALLTTLKRSIELVRRGKKVCINVCGEEDLAVIPAVLYAPKGTLVIYGQPEEGIVTIEVTSEYKRECAKILGKMEVVYGDWTY